MTKSRRLKAQQHGLRVLRLPERYSLPDEQDELEAKLQRAAREVQLLKNRLPELLLTFPDGAIFKQFAISAPVALPKEEIAARIAELRAKYPTAVRRETPRMGTGLTLTAAAAIAAPLSNPTDEEIARYNRELKDFFAEYEQYWMKSRDHENSLCRAIELSLTLHNKGTAPAEDIRLSLSLPDGLKVYDKKGRSSGPKLPAAPQPPRGPHEYMIATLRANAMLLPLEPRYPIYPIRGNVSPPSIKRTNSFLVEFSVEKLIQHRPESLHPLFLVFDSFDSGDSFHIDWRGVSASLPQPVTGRLDVVVQKITG